MSTPTVTVLPAPPVDRPRFWSLVATHVMNDFQAGAAAALLPYFVSEQHYDYAAVAGITFAATSLSSVAQPVFGWLTDRFALRPLVLVGLAVAALGIAAAGLTAANYWVTWIAIAVSGIGSAAYHPPATVDSKQVGGGTNRAMSIFSVGGNVGAAIAPLGVAIAVGAAGLSGTPLLLIPTALAVGMYLVAHLRRRRDPAAIPDAGMPGPAASATPPGDLWRRFVWLLVVVALWSLAYIAARSFVALASIARFDIVNEAGTAILTVFSLSGAAGTLVGGFLADRFGRVRVLAAGYALATLAAAGFAVAPSPALAGVAAGLFGFALFVPFSLHVTLSHSYLPRHLGTASGVTLGLATSFGGIVTPALGALADGLGPQSVFLAITAALAAAFVCALFVRERRDAGTLA